jgi:acyl-coenzyme A thioesterase PaaI-like protein
LWRNCRRQSVQSSTWLTSSRRSPNRRTPHFWEKEQIEDLNDRKRLAALALLEEKTKQLTQLGAEVAGSHYREGKKPAREVARLAEDHGAPVPGGRGERFLCEARVLKPGRTLIVVESEVYGFEGAERALTSKATVTLAALQRRVPEGQPV